MRIVLHRSLADLRDIYPQRVQRGHLAARNLHMVPADIARKAKLTFADARLPQ